MTLKRAAVAFVAAVLALLCSCASKEKASEGVPFTVLAGSELKDIETNFKDEIHKATGIDLVFTYSGSIDAIDRIANGDQFDALWVSHGKYLVMNPALNGRVLAQEKTMLSPVILGLKTSKAHALGWDTADPTWREIADAARDGKFTFGMTNPTSSNTGLTATIGLAAALAQNPDDLLQADLKSPRLADFFHGQALTAGSSGWLAESYESDQSRVDGIINYESVLLSLNAGGKLKDPLTLVYPKEGIVTADYPIMLLDPLKRNNYNTLVAYLRGKDFQTRMSAKTLRRPVNPDSVTAAAIPKRVLIELPFPGQAWQIETLLDNFLSVLRNPGSTRYVLDLSGSMSGARIADLKNAMLMLASNDSSDRFARFLNREEVGIITFSSQTSPTELFPMGSTPEDNSKARNAIAQFVRPLTAGGGTAIYSSVAQALTELGEERGKSKERRYYTVVLMTDGVSNRGMTSDDFNKWYKEQGDQVSGIQVFPILFGEGDLKALTELAALTGGRVFDSRTKSLASAFKEIRGYQ